MRRAWPILSLALAGCSASAAPQGWRHAHVERLPARRVVAIRNVEAPFPRVALPPTLKAKPKPESPKPKGAAKVGGPKPGGTPKVIVPPKPIHAPRPKPPAPQWWSDTRHPGVEVFGSMGSDGYVRPERWRYAGTTQEYTGWPPPPRPAMQYMVVPGYSFGAPGGS